MQEAEALWGAVSGSHWGAFVVGRALMSHLKAGVRLQQVQERERLEREEDCRCRGEPGRRGLGTREDWWGLGDWGWRPVRVFYPFFPKQILNSHMCPNPGSNLSTGSIRAGAPSGGRKQGETSALLFRRTALLEGFQRASGIGPFLRAWSLARRIPYTVPFIASAQSPSSGEASHPSQTPKLRLRLQRGAFPAGALRIR